MNINLGSFFFIPSLNDKKNYIGENLRHFLDLDSIIYDKSKSFLCIIGKLSEFWTKVFWKIKGFTNLNEKQIHRCHNSIDHKSTMLLVASLITSIKPCTHIEKTIVL